MKTTITWHPYPKEKPRPVPSGYMEGMIYPVLTSTRCFINGNWYGDSWILDAGDWVGEVIYWGTVEHSFDLESLKSTN